MSEMVKYTGKIKLVKPNPNETFDDQCKRLWVENGKSLEDYDNGELFDEFHKKYIKLSVQGTKYIYEYIDVKKTDPDESYCLLNGDENFMEFETVYYNGGADTSEMIQLELNKKFKNGN